MPDPFEKLQSDLESFIEQRDSLMLVVGCKDYETMYILKTLSLIEDSDSPDLFLVFGDDFIQPTPYVSVIMERLKIQHAEACSELEKQGREKLPPLPDKLFDESILPAERLKEAMLFVRSKLLPLDGQHRLIWGLFPMNIKGKDEYLRIINQLIPWNGIEPWMRNVRLFVREDIDSHAVVPFIKNAPRVLVYNPDISANAMVASAREKADDPEASEEEKMQALLTVASMDYANKQYKDALQKYMRLLKYYQDKENIMMQAFIINAIGDVFHRMDDLEKAQEWYECAIVPSTEAKSPVLLLTVVRNLGHVAYKLKQFPESEEYFVGADKLSGELRDAEAKVDSLEWLGLSQERQKKYDSAVESWESAVQLSRNLEMQEPLKRNLENLKEAYKKQHRKDERRIVEAELDELKEKRK